MFDLVHRRKRVVQAILALITLPFAFFGVDYYFRGGSSVTEVARVGAERITQAEFADSLREQQDRMRQAMGKNYDPAMFENPDVRYSIVEQLFGEMFCYEQARKKRLRVSEVHLWQ